MHFIWYKTPQQNGHLESFHGKLKFEYVWPADPESFVEAEEVIRGAFTDYNENRLHSAIGYMPPDEFAAKWRKQMTGGVSIFMPKVLSNHGVQLMRNIFTCFMTWKAQGLDHLAEMTKYLYSEPNYVNLRSIF